MNILKLGVFVAGVVFLQGCAQKTPSCADEKTVALVKQIYLDAVRQQAAKKAPGEAFIDSIMVRAPIRLDMVRTQGVDEKIGKFSCDANLEIALPERAGTFVNGATFRDALETDFGARGVEITGNTLKVQIQYDSQLTADTHNHVVEVRGLRPMAYVIVTLGSTGLLDLPKPPPPSTSESDRAVASSSPSPSLSDVANERQQAEKNDVATNQSSPPTAIGTPAQTGARSQAVVAPPITDPSTAVLAMINAAKDGNNAAILSAKVTLDSFQKPDRGDRKLAREKNKQGIDELKESAYDIAIVRFNQGVAADPSDVEVKNNLGYALMMAGKLDDAKKALIESLALDSARAAAWANLGQTLAKQGDEQSAVAAFVNTFIFSRAQSKTVEFLTNLSQSDSDPKVKSAAAKALEAPLIKGVAVVSK